MTEIVTQEQLVPPSRHIFLSPHYDDIALSCGGTVARLAESGKTPEVALIFGDHPDPAASLTDFARQLHSQWGMDAAKVIAGRRAEESVAAGILGTRATFLPFRDAIYRGARYLGNDDLFGAPSDDESGLPASIIEALQIGDEAVRVYAPLAIGFHVDHQHAFTVGIELAHRGVDVWFYEDLPYSLIPGAFDQRIAAIGDAVDPSALVEIDTQWEKKIDAILAYPSQLSTIFVDYVGIGTGRSQIENAMKNYARSVGDGRLCERFWTMAT